MHSPTVRTPRLRRLGASASVALLVGLFLPSAVTAAWQPADAGALAAHCASPSWSQYMICQSYLLERSRTMNACLPAGTSAARLQLEFVRFVERDGAVAGLDPAAAADRYLEATYGCG